ncbi:hypothetical protein [Lutibacter sp.]|uniref:hypothetical protein n=1 Tax=Lutibacter sp. TaxID=1925666 RepID=UPI001A257201|nr:hypothetical protein [Lutibacter sp.]MBI9040208.1 hypothetical protein [Lutibacter sp.]
MKGLVIAVFCVFYIIFASFNSYFSYNRNVKYAFFASLFLGLCHIYVFYVGFLNYELFINLFSSYDIAPALKSGYILLFNFQNNFEIFLQAYIDNSWLVFNGYYNLIFLALEVVFIFILGAYMLIDRARSPYSELKADWYDDEKELKPFTFIENVDDFTKMLSYGANFALKNIKRLSDPLTPHSVFKISTLNNEPFYLTVVNVSKAPDEKEYTIVKYVLIDKMFIETLFSIFKGEVIEISEIPALFNHSNRVTPKNYNQEEYESFINLQLNNLRKKETRIFWVGDEHRTHPWSLMEGGCTLVVLYQDSGCRGYDKVKRPDAYGQKITRDYISNNYNGNKFGDLETYIDEIFIAEENSFVLKRVWSSNSGLSPWEILEKYRIN